jgi:hypothetical protein
MTIRKILRGCAHDRLDVLGLDLDGRLVVAELKRGLAPDTVEMLTRYGVALRDDLAPLNGSDGAAVDISDDIPLPASPAGPRRA